MVVSAKTTVVAALAVLVSVLTMVVPAQAAAKETGDVGVRAWTPGLTPLSPSPQETVKRNLTTAQRDNALADCWPGYLCVAVGQGDGKHTVWELYYCTRRSVTNFIDAGAMVSNQSRGTITRTRNQSLRVLDEIPADNKKHGFNAYDTWYIDVC